MITIIQDKCTACGVCVKICHESCLEINGRGLELKEEFCSTCTQCIAVCPEGAILWQNIQPIPFQDGLLPTPESLEELLRQRRTVRRFRKKIPSRELIDEVVQMALTAPTHCHDFRAVAVDDPALLEALDRATYRNVKAMYRWLFRPWWSKPLVGLLSPENQKEFLKAKPKLEYCLEIGRGYAQLPPVLVFLVHPRGVPLALESAQYLLYSIDLYARTRGLGFRNLVGNQGFFNRSREVRSMLGLARDERIYAVGGLGYPAVRFRSKVAGRRLQLVWREAAQQI